VIAGIKTLQFRRSPFSNRPDAIGCPVNDRVVNDDHRPLRGGMYVALNDPTAHRESLAETFNGVLRYDLRPTPMCEIDGPTVRRWRLRRPPPDGGSYQSARQRTQNERSPAEPEPPNVIGNDGRISLLLDDRVTHAGTLSGKYGCCPT
jgi:hypothetical protein